MVVHAAHHVESVVFVGEALHQFHVFGGIIVRAFGQLVVQPGYLVLHLADVGKGRFRFLDDCALIGQYHHLWQVANGCPAGRGDHTACRRLQTCQNL